MTIYMARVPGAPKDYQRILRWNTDAYFHCPNAEPMNRCESLKSGVMRWESVSEDKVIGETEADGSHLFTLIAVRRGWKLSKSGRRPVCKACGAAMEWAGWYVWVTDELTAERPRDFDGLSIRNASNDKKLWAKWAKTLKERQRLIDKGYAGK